jgi:hypothetical protein
VIRKVVETAPSISLPLLSSRVVAKKYMTSVPAGQARDGLLQDCVTAHLETLELDASKQRWAPPRPFSSPAPEPAARPPPTPGAAAAAAALLNFLGEVRSSEHGVLQPSTDVCVAFGLRFDRGAGRSSRHVRSAWLVVLQHYRQLWCCRAVLQNGPVEAAEDADATLREVSVDVPLDFRRLLEVVEMESAGLSASNLPSGLVGGVPEMYLLRVRTTQVVATAPLCDFEVDVAAVIASAELGRMAAGGTRLKHRSGARVLGPQEDGGVPGDGEDLEAQALRYLRELEADERAEDFRLSASPAHAPQGTGPCGGGLRFQCVVAAFSGGE